MEDFQGKITNQSRLIELLNTLSLKEKALLPRFCQIPMFNSGPMWQFVEPLINVCISHTWSTSKGSLDKKIIFHQLFPKQMFHEGKFDKVMVDAYKVLQKYILVKEYLKSENEFFQAYDFANILRTKGLESRSRNHLAKLNRFQSELTWQNSDYYYQQFLIENQMHLEECFHNQAKGNLNVPNTLSNLDKYYHLNRLELLNRFLLQQKVANLIADNFTNNMIEGVDIPKEHLTESASIRINFIIFTILKKPFPAPFDIALLFEQLRTHENDLHPDSLKEFYSYLRNMCTLFSLKNFDDEEIRVTLFELYKDNLARGYLHYEGKLHPSVYLAVSLVAVRVKEHDWALKFIEKHKHEIISETETQDIYRFNLANYYFGVGKFEECLDNIPDSSPFVDYLLQAKRLELKAYYELNSDLLSFKLDAFKMFLSRTSQKLLSESQRSINIEFANFLTQLVASRPGDKKRSEKLIERIQSKKQAAEWLWLLTKAKTIGAAR